MDLKIVDELQKVLEQNKDNTTKPQPLDTTSYAKMLEDRREFLIQRIKFGELPVKEIESLYTIASPDDLNHIKKYFHDTSVVTDWSVGGPITWHGIWKGKPYEDKGVVLAIEPYGLLRTTHWSPPWREPKIHPKTIMW